MPWSDSIGGARFGHFVSPSAEVNAAYTDTSTALLRFPLAFSADANAAYTDVLGPRLAFLASLTSEPNAGYADVVAGLGGLLAASSDDLIASTDALAGRLSHLAALAEANAAYTDTPAAQLGFLVQLAADVAAALADSWDMLLAGEALLALEAALFETLVEPGDSLDGRLALLSAFAEDLEGILGDALAAFATIQAHVSESVGLCEDQLGGTLRLGLSLSDAQTLLDSLIATKDGVSAFLLAFADAGRPYADVLAAYRWPPALPAVMAPRRPAATMVAKPYDIRWPGAPGLPRLVEDVNANFDSLFRELSRLKAENDLLKARIIALEEQGP